MRNGIRLLITLGFCFFSQSVLAAAFQFYELGTPIVGTADVGQAVVNDASSSYFNPAAMALLPQSEFMLGSEVLLPYTNFSKNPNRTTITGDNGGNAGALSSGIALFYAYHYSPQLKLGINLTSPYGGF